MRSQHSTVQRSTIGTAAIFTIVMAIAMTAVPARAQCNCTGGDGVQTFNQTIVIDGSMTDWATVLADPDNNTCDGGYEGGASLRFNGNLRTVAGLGCLRRLCQL